jgi:hypothetical protein
MWQLPSAAALHLRIIPGLKAVAGVLSLRITLRKLAQSGNSEILRSWKMLYDRGAEEDGDTVVAAHG